MRIAIRWLAISLIVMGTAATANDGTFKVTFTAKPDPSVPQKDEPTFHYAISADVG